MKKMMRTTALGGALVFMAASAQAMDGGFMVGNTTFKMGGYVDLDLHYTDYSAGTTPANRIDRDMYIPSLTPTGPADANGNTHFDMQAQTSRLSFTAKNGGTTGYIEIDFLGGDGNERVSNSFAPRIRRAFIKNGNWLMGQEWSTFQNLSAIPESASFLAASDGQIFVRQPMVRWTNGPLQIALENPGESRITNNGIDDEGNPAILRFERDEAERPDIVVRYNYKADFGNISASLLNRQIKMTATDEDDNFDEDTISFNIAGRVKAGPGDVRFSYSSGEGMGRYIGLHAANEADLRFNADGDEVGVDLNESTGYVLAYRLPLGNDGARLNIGMSSLEVDDPAEAELETVSSQYVAYLWSPAPKLTYGIEYMTGTTEFDAPQGTTDEGDIDRFTFSAKFAF
jgi:hypothetical protein